MVGVGGQFGSILLLYVDTGRDYRLHREEEMLS